MPSPLPPAAIALTHRWFPDLDLDRVRIVTGGPVCWYVRRAGRGAMTLAPYIFFGRAKFDPRDARSLALLVHELKHVEQVGRMGHIRFYLRYAAGLIRNGFRYSHDHPLEKEAYALQAAVFEPLRDALEGPWNV
jgi:hypothetical protein